MSGSLKGRSMRLRMTDRVRVVMDMRSISAKLTWIKSISNTYHVNDLNSSLPLTVMVQGSEDYPDLNP